MVLPDMHNPVGHRLTRSASLVPERPQIHRNPIFGRTDENFLVVGLLNSRGCSKLIRLWLFSVVNRFFFGREDIHIQYMVTRGGSGSLVVSENRVRCSKHLSHDYTPRTNRAYKALPVAFDWSIPSCMCSDIVGSDSVNLC